MCAAPTVGNSAREILSEGLVPQSEAGVSVTARLVINAMPELVAILGPDGRIDAANDRLSRQLGVAPGALEGQSILNFVGLPIEPFAVFLRRASGTRDPLPGAVTLRGADGREFAFRADAARLTEDGADELRILLRCRPRQDGVSSFHILNRKIKELTEEVEGRRNAEAELHDLNASLEERVTRELEYRSRTEQARQQAEILDWAGVGVAQIDTAGKFSLINDQFCNMLGYPREQLLARQMQDLMHPDDMAEALDAFIRVIESGVARVIDQHYVRRDGSSIWLSNSVSLGRSAGSGDPYVVVIAQDITGRKLTERALNKTQADLRMLLDSAADGFCAITRDGVITLCNASFLRMTGFQRDDEVLGKDFHALTHHSHADGSSYPRSESPVLKAAQTGIHAHVNDDVFFRADGTSFPVEYWARPIVRESLIEGAVCTFIDVTERKQAEARQQLLNHELAHRVKNTLAVVQAIVSQTLRNSGDPKDAVPTINARLFALSHAHEVLMRTRWGGASITDVIKSGIAVHGPENPRIEIDGPRIDVGPKSALALTMALHELCTNAVKYGALSSDTGSVALDWTLSGGAADAQFHLRWRERGGPPVTAPTRTGFGSRVIGEYCKSELGGDAAMFFKPGGFEWTLSAPLSSMKK